MGGRPARHVAGRQALTRRGLVALVALALLAACSRGGPPPQPQSFDALGKAVSAVNAQRAAVLAAVDAVQAGASALDDTDAACATGKGVSARTALRTAQPLAAKARTTLDRLPALTARYQAALTALGTEAKAVTGAQRTAVDDVVRTGQAEAAAVQRFRTAAAGAWPAYAKLLDLESLWVTRAVTPWYRTAAEGAAAYTILLEPSRPALDRARTTVGDAASAAVDASRAQSATLAAANTALASLRPTP